MLSCERERIEFFTDLEPFAIGLQSCSFRGWVRHGVTGNYSQCLVYALPRVFDLTCDLLSNVCDGDQFLWIDLAYSDVVSINMRHFAACDGETSCLKDDTLESKVERVLRFG